MIPVLIGLASALASAWVLLTVVLVLARPRRAGVADVALFLPNLIRLLTRLYRDPAVPRAARVRVWIAIVYNVQPINLIPDFIPVIGFADNVVVTAWALRSAVTRAGAAPVTRAWPGSPDQLALLFRVARLGPPPG